MTEQRRKLSTPRTLVQRKTNTIIPAPGSPNTSQEHTTAQRYRDTRRPAMSTLAETLAYQTPHTVGEWSHALDIVRHDRILVEALMDFSRCGWHPVAAALTLHKALNTPITEPLMVNGQ